MRLRLFRAPTMAEAMAAVRAELGEEAVILGSRKVAGAMEVTAALEPSDPILIPPIPQAAQRGPVGQPIIHPARPDALLRHNLPPELREKLCGHAALNERLERNLTFAELPWTEHRPLLLAGPPGAGKTISCAKLATRAVMHGAHPLVITTDGNRAGAVEQLAAFTRLLGLTLAVAPGPSTLQKAMAHAQPGQSVLIDTAGCDPFDPGQATELHALARTANAEVVLVLPAGLDPLESGELAQAFNALGARHLLPTRLDIARRLGGVLAAAATGLALTEAGTGPGAADGLTTITPDWLAACLEGPQGASA